VFRRFGKLSRRMKSLKKGVDSEGE